MRVKGPVDHLCQHCGRSVPECGAEAGSSLTLTFLSHYSPATTSEGKLAKIGHKIGKNLDKTVKETMNYLKSLLPHAYEVMRSS